MSVNKPIVNAGQKYINGLKLAFASTTTITVAAGAARNSTNVNDITLASAVTIDAAVTGLNGLDTGALANNTFYAVHLIGDSTSNNASGAMLSTSATAPNLPYGYDMFRRIGYVLTSGAAAILDFVQIGESSDRWMWYDVAIQELNAGASAAYASVDCATSVPAGAKMINFKATVTPTAADDKAVLRPLGATGADGFAQLSGVVAAKLQVGQLVVPCSAASVVEYKVTGTLSLHTQAYLDLLA